MKLAIWSDLHVGHRMYRTDEDNFNKFEHIGYDVLQKNVDIIKKEKPDLIINAGDTFETANPSVLAMTNYVKAMNELSEFPTMAILGNHDFAFANKRNKCSAVAMANHTYFADYEIKTVELNDILFVMMPYIYDTKENIEKYLKQCEDIAKSTNITKKILITHGVTEKYYREHFIGDPIMLSDDLVSLYDLIIIGHIHTPFSYKQGKSLVISPGSMIDYQASEYHTGPIFLDTDTMKFNKVIVETPHIIKKSCTEKDINDILNNITQNIYHISFNGNIDNIDNDLFIKAKNKAVNLIIDIVKENETTEDESKKSTSLLNIYEWINTNYPDYVDIFNEAKGVISS